MFLSLRFQLFALTVRVAKFAGWLAECSLARLQFILHGEIAFAIRTAVFINTSVSDWRIAKIPVWRR
jgi:hypothetical protein